MRWYLRSTCVSPAAWFHIIIATGYVLYIPCPWTTDRPLGVLANLQFECPLISMLAFQACTLESFDWPWPWYALRHLSRVHSPPSTGYQTIGTCVYVIDYRSLSQLDRPVCDVPGLWSIEDELFICSLKDCLGAYVSPLCHTEAVGTQLSV